MMYWYCHVMWRSVMKAALVPSNVKPFNHVTWHWTSDSYFICTCMFFVLSSILLVYICIYIYTHTLVQPMLYIYTSVERYNTHILYHFSHIYLCASGHVDFTSQNTRLWNITHRTIYQDRAIFVSLVCNLIQQDIVPHCTLACRSI